MRTISIALALALIAPGVSAQSQEAAIAAARIAAPRPPETVAEVIRAMNYLTLHKWELFDANHDGALSPDEWLEFIFSTYCVFNASEDERILFTEYAQVKNGPVHDPFLSLQPMRELHAQFDSLDHGHKGYLTIDDFRRARPGVIRGNDRKPRWVRD